MIFFTFTAPTQCLCWIWIYLTFKISECDNGNSLHSQQTFLAGQISGDMDRPSVTNNFRSPSSNMKAPLRKDNMHDFLFLFQESLQLVEHILNFIARSNRRVAKQVAFHIVLRPGESPKSSQEYPDFEHDNRKAAQDKLFQMIE